MLLRRIKNIYHCWIAVLFSLFYGFPAKKLQLIGVTGTDGKTTTTSLIYHILKKVDKKASFISSIEANVGGKRYKTGFHVTTPSASIIQKLCRQAVLKGGRYFVIESTAHGIDQGRLWGLNFEVSVLTNITHEHLKSLNGYDYFKNIANLIKIKTGLLLNSKGAVVNRDDSSFKKVSQILKKHKKKFFTYGRDGKADFGFERLGKVGQKLPLFNRYNYLAAYVVCRQLGVKREVILEGLNSFKLPRGRLEMVYQQPLIYIDFAHTINAFKNVLPFLKGKLVKEKRAGRLVHLFGSAGLRDKSKRPLMGEASGQNADLVILTEEDYRTEDPNKICTEIGLGLSKAGLAYLPVNKFQKTKRNKIYTIVTNRKKAIKTALSILRKNDLLVLTGKSHEKSLCRGKKEYPWDEKKILLRALKGKKFLN